jgi:hypothetical protein
VHEEGGQDPDTGTHEHIAQKMLSQVDPGIADGYGHQQVGQFALPVFFEKGQQGSQRKDRSRVAGRKAGKSDMR